MKIIYEAFDGVRFDDELECTEYEWKKEHEEGMKDIVFYDNDGKILEDKLSEETYSKVMHINVLTQRGVDTIRAISNYTGFCCYDDVNETGNWFWDSNDECFKRR